MNYQIIPPCKELQNFISHFWMATWDETSSPPHTSYYAIASSLTEITFAFRTSSKYADLLFSLVQGHTDVPKQFKVDGFYHLIGVAFYSHAIPSLFGVPSSDLNKEFISLDTFLGPQGIILNDQIVSTTTTQQRIQILSDYFISILHKKQRTDSLILHAIQKIKKHNGETKIEKLADEFCLSQKQFNRRFKEYSGFNPKLYSRIIRFESVIKNISPNSNLTDTAYSNGYYDQAHFIHEFKSFTGFSPKDFWKLNP